MVGDRFNQDFIGTIELTGSLLTGALAVYHLVTRDNSTYLLIPTILALDGMNRQGNYHGLIASIRNYFSRN